MAKIPDFLTTAEASQFLGYKHIESFRRAIRRCDLRLVQPIRDFTHRGHPWMFAKDDLIAQRRVMPQSGRPREGQFARRKQYNKF